MPKALILALLLLLAPLPTHAAIEDGATGSDHGGIPVARRPRLITEEALEASYGCLIGGVSGISAALAVGPQNLVNVVAGGIVTPASPAVLAVGMMGVIFASFCTVGQALTPMALDLSDRLSGPVAQASETAAQYLDEAMAATGRAWQEGTATLGRHCAGTTICGWLPAR